MHPSEYAPHLEFLKKSASLLVSESPSTSAHLLGVHNQILHHNFRSLNGRQQEHFCGACGSIRKSEWTKTVNVSGRRRKDSKKGATCGLRYGVTIYTCLRCHRRMIKPFRRKDTRTEVASQNPSSETNAQVPDQPTTTATDSSTPNDSSLRLSTKSEANKTSENASSKKRAKTRKQGGLQALLASKQKSSEDKTSSSSLDLFDFLQQ